jgi:hypothetical protein
MFYPGTNKFDRGASQIGKKVPGAGEEGPGMNLSEKCRVDDCDRRSAASVIQDTLPGPLPLCLTHMEDYRMNSAGWIVTWEQTLAEPTSVKAAEVAAVGRTTAGPVGSLPPASSSGNSLRKRLAMRRGSRS